MLSLNLSVYRNAIMNFTNSQFDPESQDVAMMRKHRFIKKFTEKGSYLNYVTRVTNAHNTLGNSTNLQKMQNVYKLKHFKQKYGEIALYSTLGFFFYILRHLCTIIQIS